jgi:hypothetical protein
VHCAGLNERRLPWDYYGWPATGCIREHWERLRPEVYTRVGIDPPERQVDAA